MHIYYWMYVYMAAYSHTYPYMQYKVTCEVCTIALQRNSTQEAGVYYTKLTHLWCSAI